MKKIPTIFERDETAKGRPVVDRVKPECQWVLDGEGLATAKLDGTNVKVTNGMLWKRQKPKVRDYDEASYLPCDRENPADRWAFEGFDRAAARGPVLNGVYELIGPKVQGNPHQCEHHQIVRVVPYEGIVLLVVNPPPRTFDGLRQWFEAVSWDFFAESGAGRECEGIVFHHPDGRFAKIKRRDFGLPWPVESARP